MILIYMMLHKYNYISLFIVLQRRKRTIGIIKINLKKKINKNKDHLKDKTFCCIIIYFLFCIDSFDLNIFF